MKKLGNHINVLKMLGYFKDIKEPIIAFELCENGALLDVLRKHTLHPMVFFDLKFIKCCNFYVALIRKMNNGRKSSNLWVFIVS